MSELLDKSKIEIKLGQYGVANASALINPLLLSRVQEYKRTVSGRMVPLDRDDIRQKIPNSDYFASRKVDGEFTILVYDSGTALTVNPGGTVRVGLPAIEEAGRRLAAAGIQQAIIAAELYVEHGGRERVHDVTRVARSPEDESQLGQLALRVFDVLELDQKAIEGPFAETWTTIETLFRDGERVRPVQTRSVKTGDEIAGMFQELVEEGGAEGLVLRSDSAGMFKIKPRHTLDAVIIGFTESTGERSGMLHDLLLAVRRDDGTFHVLCRVGGGLSDELRRSLLADLKDEVVASEYAEVNSDHVSYEMVEPRLVIEISCLDLISQSTRGAPINRMTLDWDAEARTYRVLRRLPLVSVISPQFVRFREDKTVAKDDVRIQQVAKAVEVPMLERDAKQLTLAKSELVRREVFTKVLKGETMVRKFVMWKTNKESMASDFPAYVVHYTDYSPNRATPLARDVRVTQSEAQAMALFDKFKEDNIKKGWDVAGAAATEDVKETETSKPARKKAAGKKAAEVEVEPAEGTEAVADVVPVKKKAARKSVKKKSAKDHSVATQPEVNGHEAVGSEAVSNEAVSIELDGADASEAKSDKPPGRKTPAKATKKATGKSAKKAPKKSSKAAKQTGEDAM